MVMGYYIVVNALCDWGKVCFVDESFREANKIIVENLSPQSKGSKSSLSGNWEIKK